MAGRPRVGFVCVNALEQDVLQYRITRATLNPTTARFVLDHPAVDRYDVSSVRSVSCGGMPMPKSTAVELSERFGVFPPTSARPNRIDALLRS